MNGQQQIRMYWIHALTPLHVGAGRGVGFIDLPIMREKLTNWPLVPGTAFKGVLADHYGVTTESRESRGDKGNPKHRAAFGLAGPEASNSGSLVFTDARIVCLPVRSLYGTFGWCTSVLALKRLYRDLQWAGMTDGLKPLGSAGTAAPTARTALPIPAANAPEPAGKSTTLLCGAGSKVYLEDLDFAANADDDVKAWGEKIAAWVFPNDDWKSEFLRRFVVLPDDVFNFLCETATQVDARVRIEDESKTVAKGALWYEESLPPETILAGIAWCGPVFGNRNGKVNPSDSHSGAIGKLTAESLMSDFCGCGAPLNLQIGGKATVGRGQVRAMFSGPKGT